MKRKKVKKKKKKETEEKEEEKKEERKGEKNEGIEEEKFDFQLETVTHTKDVTPVLKAKPSEFKLEEFIQTIETKKEEKEKENFKYSHSLYDKSPKYFGEREENKSVENQQIESFRVMIRPKHKALEFREIAEINIKPERKAREMPFIQEPKFEEVIKYEKAKKQISRPQEIAPEFKERYKRIKKYEPIH